MIRPLHYAQIFGVAVMVATVAPSLGCGQTACFQWLESQGACPDRTKAREFFGNCNDIESIDNDGKFGNSLCCYSVSKAAGRVDGIDCTGNTGVGVGVGPGPAVTVGSVGPSSTFAVSTTSGGGKCDLLGVCGDPISGCMGCALNGPCAPELDACATSTQCTLYQNCVGKCSPQMPACFMQCVTQYPMGAQVYDNLINCTICLNCPSSCPTMAANCSGGSSSATSGGGGAGGAGVGGAGGK